MADKNGKNATVKRPAVKAPGRVLQVRSTGRTDWRERQGSRAFLATSSLKPAHLAGRGGSPVIARLPTIQRIAGSRHSLSASFTSRSRPAVRTPTDECATSRYSDNVRRSGTKFADSPLEGDGFELLVPGRARPSNRHGRREGRLENGSGSVGEPKGSNPSNLTFVVGSQPSQPPLPIVWRVRLSHRHLRSRRVGSDALERHSTARCSRRTVPRIR
jgi:hypothetical protein